MALLAAGTIIKGDGEVKGLTTGIGLWRAGAVGMAAGTGMYAVSVFIAVISFAILFGLRKSPHRRLSDLHQPAEDGEKMANESKP